MDLKKQAQELRLKSPVGASVEEPTAATYTHSEYHTLKDSLHSQLLSRIDLNVMSAMKPERVRDELGLLVERLLQDTGVALNAPGRKQLVTDILDEITGLGPLEPLLADP